MRIQLMTAAAVFLLSAAGATAQSRPQTPPDDEQPRSAQALPAPSLTGTWKSAPDELKLTSDFDKSVWGANATSVRTVELVVRPNGEGTLRVTKKVVDPKGRAIPASTWVEEAQLQIGEATPGVATRLEHQVKVVKAIRLFPDDPNYRWDLEGTRIKVVTFSDGDGNTLEVRYDTPEGRGSFWETLKREHGAAAPRPRK